MRTRKNAPLLRPDHARCTSMSCERRRDCLRWLDRNNGGRSIVDDCGMDRLEFLPADEAAILRWC